MVVTSTAGQRDELRLVLEVLGRASAIGAGPSADLGGVRVLDCGGGTGRIAVALAELGADVTVVDISVDALATLSRRSIDAGVADRVHAVPGDIEALGECVDDQNFDLALVHGVLDVVDPAATLAGVRAAVRPGGVVSVLVNNRAAGIIAKILGGELEAALAELQAGTDAGFGADAVARLCVDAGLVLEQVRGVGVFSDLIPFGVPGGVTAAGNSVDQLGIDLESSSSHVAPFRDIAARLHLLGRRPASSE